MLIWGQITPKLAPDLTAMPTALYVPRAMLSVYFNRLCSAWCSKGTTQTRGQEQSGQWLVGTYQAFSPRSTHLHLGQRRQHNSAIQRRDSSFTWSKMWMHTAAQCGVVNWCERSFVRQSPIFLCNLAISPSCAVCSVQRSGHGTGLLSPKQSGMDRPSASACLKGKAGKDKETKTNNSWQRNLVYPPS